MGFIFLGVGVLLLLYWFYLGKRAKATANWPSTPGQITECTIVSVRDEDGNRQDLNIAYSYQVAGNTYQSRRVSIGPINENQIANKYPAGTLCTVFYDPAKPQSAFLEPVRAGSKIVVLVVAAAMFLAGVFLLVTHTGANRTPAVSYAQASALYNQGKFAEAKSAFEDLANAGDANAKVYLGVIYTKGQGVPQDLIEGQKWFILAGQAGNSNRGELLRGLPPDQEAQAEARAKAWTPK